MPLAKPWLIPISALLIVCSSAAGHSQSSDADVTRGEFLGAKPTEYPAWFKESFLEFQLDVEEAAEAGKRLLVVFHQDGCPYCNQLVEVNFAQRDIEQYVRKHFDVVALNMWGDREVVTVGGKPYTEKTFAAALRVQFTPTLLFFDESGKVVLRLNGYQPPGEFKNALRFVAEKRERTGPYREYVKTNAPVKSAGKLNDQTFFSTPPLL